MNHRDYQILSKILQETEIVENLICDFDYDSFSSDERTKRAVCMTLINIGELVKTLSEEIRNENKHIPWRAVSGLRDVTAHRYQTLKMEDIWETVNTDLPAFQNQIIDLLR